MVEKTVEKTVKNIEEVQEEVQAYSPAQEQYKALIEKYKEQNPVKYEQKKAELERKLGGKITIETDKLGNRKTFVSKAKVSKK